MKKVRETPISEENYTDLMRLYQDVREEWGKSLEPQEQNYWQGKKDALRTVLALLAPDETTKRRWEVLQESSNQGYATKREILQAQVNDAYRILNMAKSGPYYELRYDARTFVEWVKRMGTYTG